MTEKEFAKLIDQYRAGRCTKEEEDQLESWFNDFARKSSALESVADYSAVDSRVREKLGIATRPSARQIPLYIRYAAAAAAVAMVVFGLWFFAYREDASLPRNEDLVQHDIAPGKNGATITLANGEVIQLSSAKKGVIIGNGKVVYSDRSLQGGTTKPSAGEIATLPHNEGKGNGEVQHLTASTAKGQTYEFTLPDGTHVWLNADSKIIFPTKFAAQRRVQLRGEGYFEVAKDKAHPFVVQAGGQEVEVLGTQFNINSYADERGITTALVEGSVKVSADGAVKVIRPGQQVINRDNQLQVGSAELENITDWKEGDFNFDGVDFRLAMRKVARWYNVEVLYDADVPMNLVSGGWFSRNQKLSTILKSIEKAGLVSFTISGQTVRISKYKRS